MHENEAQEQSAAAAGAREDRQVPNQLSDKQLPSAAVVEFLLKYPERQTQAARRMVKDAEQRLMADEGLQNKPHLGRPRLVSDDAAMRASGRSSAALAPSATMTGPLVRFHVNRRCSRELLIRGYHRCFNCTPETVWAR
jgi:hypothetical protein